MTAIFGHRGARGERPENTIEAFRHAGSLGLAGIECDIALTRDFIPVLHHDPEIPQGNLIRDLSLQELRQLAPRIPTLVEAFDAVPEMEWLIEIKTFPDAPAMTHAPETMAEAVLGVLRNAVKLRHVCILAFDWRVLSAVRRGEEKIRVICLTEPKTEQSRDLWWGNGFGEMATPEAVARMNAYGWAPSHGSLTMAHVSHAQLLGLKIFPWTVNEVAEFHRLAPRVDGIITDFPSRFVVYPNIPADLV